MSARRFRWMLPGLLLVTACFEGNTEERSIDLYTSPLYHSEVEPLSSGTRALQGSRACVEVGWVRTDDGWGGFSPIEACYAITLDGAPFGDGDCIELDLPGEHLLEYAPLDDCPFEELRDFVVPDRFRLPVVTIHGLRARLEWFLELAALRWHDPDLAERLPEDAIPSPDEPLRLVPGVEVAFPVNVIDEAGERVAWTVERGRVVETRAGAGARELYPLDDYDTLFPVSIGPGERSTLSLSLSGANLLVGEVIATPAEEAASLEIVASYLAGAPVAARAMVRDAEGRVIYGAPVEWTLVEGHLAVGPIGEVTPRPIPEYSTISDACVPPPSAPEPRRAVVRAQLGSLVEELELEWTAMPDDEPSDEPFEPHPFCQQAGLDDGRLDDRGCGCTAQSSGPRAPLGGPRGWSWLVVLLAGLARRRRRGTAP